MKSNLEQPTTKEFEKISRTINGKLLGHQHAVSI